MTLEWNKQELENKFNELAILLAKKNIEFKDNKDNVRIENFIEKIEKSIFCYYNLLSIAEEKKDTDMLYSNGIDSIENLMKETNYFMRYLPKEILESIIKIIGNLDIFYLKKDLVYHELSKVKIDDEELIERNTSLFYYLNPGFIKYLKYIYKNKLVQTTVIDDVENNGAVYMDRINHIPYGIILKNNTASDCCTFNHEIMHMIEYFKNPNIYNIEKSCVSELNTIFVTLLTNYIDFNNNFYKLDSLYSFDNYLTNIKESIIDLGMLITIKNYNYKKIKVHTINKLLSNKYNLNNKLTKRDICNLQFQEEFNYFYSCCAALHLLEEYKKDEEKGLYLFNKGIEISPKDQYSFFKNIEFDYKDYEYGINLFLKQDEFIENEIKRIRKP